MNRVALTVGGYEVVEWSGDTERASGSALPELMVPQNQQRLLSELRGAERRGELGVAARLSACLGGRFLRSGRYGEALHWLDWSLQLRRAANDLALRSLWPTWQLRFWAVLMAGQLTARDTLLPDWALGSAEERHWYGQFLLVQQLMAAQQYPEALRRAQDCWARVVRRDWLLYFVNPLVRLLLSVRAGREALDVARRTQTLTQALPGEHGRHARLCYGMALSGEHPAQAVQPLGEAMSDLFVPWQTQAGLYLAESLSRLGRPDEARELVRALAPQLRRCSAQGLAALTHPDMQLQAQVWPDVRPDADQEVLQLRFLGRMDATCSGQPLPLRPRFAELLVSLSLHPEGQTNEQLALAVYGERRDPACCKTELSRLKRLVPLGSRPYRLDLPVQADYLQVPILLRCGEVRRALDLYRGPLLPASEAPEIRARREELEEAVRSAVLEEGDPELLWLLGSRLHHDLEVWEALAARLPAGDPRRSLTRAHVHSLYRSWGMR